MKLKAIGRYRNDPLGVAYNAGEVFEVDDAFAALLMTDSPGTFEEYTEPPRKTTKSASTKDN